jgi:hypothetical protein
MEGWRTLVSEEWAGCVRLHNLPFLFSEVHEAPSLSTTRYIVSQPNHFRVIVSLHDLAHSAADWHPYQFTRFSAVKAPTS